MRLTTNKTKNGVSFYVIQSIKRDGKRSSEVVEKLGTDKEICERYGCSDAAAWAQSHVEELNRQQKEKNHKVLIPFHTDVRIPLGQKNCFNVGYLFLQQIYFKLKLPEICRTISSEYGFDYSLDEILSRLIYGRILYPSSKLSCYEQSFKLLEQPGFHLHQIYRALSVLAEKTDYVQSALYENSLKMIDRKSGVLFYDCTNYFFETEEQEGIKQYGPSKEHRPSPIVQMGLFMDASGLPLAFSINPGNTNEQKTLKPLEQRILKDFSLSRFIVCTDAGLASEANRRFNNYGGRCFITTQSIKTLKKELKEWCLDPRGWHLKGSDALHDISRLEDSEENQGKIFYKERLVEGYDAEQDVPFNQTLIVSFSLKYKRYLQKIRNQQIERARAAINSGEKRLETHNQNDYRRFVSRVSVTKDGEVASSKLYGINEDLIAEEEKYDGFYAVCTNLEDDADAIIEINKKRWEIEESFRIMKSEFEARPVYLKREDRIAAHFLTCFIALLTYRILERKLNNQYTCPEIIKTLKDMKVTSVGDEGFIPSYTRTALTDALHEMAGFRTDYELMKKRSMQGILSNSKK